MDIQKAREIFNQIRSLCMSQWMEGDGAKFAEMMREFREALGLNLRAFAGRISMSYLSVQRWEGGTLGAPPRSSSILAIDRMLISFPDPGTPPASLPLRTHKTSIGIWHDEEYICLQIQRAAEVWVIINGGRYLVDRLPFISNRMRRAIGAAIQRTPEFRLRLWYSPGLDKNVPEAYTRLQNMLHNECKCSPDTVEICPIDEGVSYADLGMTADTGQIVIRVPEERERFLLNYWFVEMNTVSVPDDSMNFYPLMQGDSFPVWVLLDEKSATHRYDALRKIV